MNVLMLSKQGRGLTVADKIAREGHPVKVWIRYPRCTVSGTGIVERVHSFRPHISWANLVIGDEPGFGMYSPLLGRSGKPTIGIDAFGDALGDRAEALFEHAGITDGSVSPMLKGTPLQIGAWFNGRDWVLPFTFSFKETRLFEGGLGPLTDCMGSVVMVVKGRPPMIEKTLFPLAPFLRKSGYAGPIHLSCIAGPESVHPTGILCGFDYDSIEATMEGLREPALDLLFETAVGVKKRMRLIKDYLISVRLSVPPWPSASDSCRLGTPIEGLNDKNLKHILFVGAYNDDGFKVGSDGVVLKATAWGETVREARRRVYRTLNRLDIQDKQYRRDVGRKVEKSLKRLEEFGHIDHGLYNFDEWRQTHGDSHGQPDGSRSNGESRQSV